MENDSPEQPKGPSATSQLAQKGIQKAGKAAVNKITSKIATSAVGKAVGAMAANLAPGVGHAIFAATQVIGSLVKAFGFNKDQVGQALAMGAYGAASLGSLGVGAALPAAALMGAGALAIGGAGAFTSAAATLSSGILIAITSIGTLILAGIGTGILLIVSFTVFTFLVINNSAYVTPKGEPPGSSTDPDGPIDPGQPGEACFDFSANWPTGAVSTPQGSFNFRDNMVRATQMMANATPYINKLCAGGRIMLEWGGGESECCSGFGGQQLSLHSIRIWASGAYSYPTAIYTLAHESGHVYYWQDLSRVARYRDSAANAERPICSYPVAVHPIGEDYPEMIAVYIRLAPGLGGPTGTPGTKLSCVVPVPSKYPATLNFAISDIFDGVRHGW